MELLQLIPAIIVLVYWIVERSYGPFHFFKSFSAINKEPNIKPASHPTSIVEEDLREDFSLILQLKRALTSTGLKHVMDEEDGMVWVLLADDDQYIECRDVFITVQSDIQLISYSIGVISDLKDDDITPITELCNRLNDRITFGRFIYDYSDAAVRLVIYYHLMKEPFNRNHHQIYLGALLKYKLDMESCFVNVKLKKELPIVAVMGK